MSSSFGKENKNSGNIEDDTSFYTFLAGILIVVVIYYFFAILKRIFYKIPFNDENNYINCHCSKCKKRYEEYKLKIKGKNINKGLYINIFLFLLFLYLFISCSKRIQNKEIFDPYEILEISPNEEISQIKKSYKKLSLKYHPDKNRDDKSAKEKFMLINKAYKILTNEKAKKNYEKYGNPDGPGILTIGLALPLFLFQGQVGFYILLVLSILLVIIFPIMFIRWSKERNKYNSNGLLLQDLPLYYKYIDKNTLITELPFVIGMSYEFEKINIEYNEQDIKDIFNSYNKYFPKDYKNEFIPFKNMFAIAVLYIHYSGAEILIKDKNFLKYFNSNKNIIIEKSIFLIDELILNIFELNRVYEFNKGINEFKSMEEYSKEIKDFEDFGIKDFDLNLILTLLQFRARIFHETNIKTEFDELLQFPENKKNIEIFKQNNYSSINDLILMNKEKKDNWIEKLNNYNDIKEVLNIYPLYNIEVNITNQRFEEAGNLFTFNIIIKRGNKDNKKELGFLHSNNYYDNYEEKAYVIIYDINNKKIANYQKIKFENEYEEKKVEHLMLTEKNNINNFTVYLISISYPGIIIKKEVEIDVKENNHLLKNFIKNRVEHMMSIEEFRDNYGIEENIEENNELHEHED